MVYMIPIALEYNNKTENMKEFEKSSFNLNCIYIFPENNYLIKMFHLHFRNTQGRTIRKWFSPKLFFYIKN